MDCLLCLPPRRRDRSRDSQQHTFPSHAYAWRSIRDAYVHTHLHDISRYFFAGESYLWISGWSWIVETGTVGPHTDDRPVILRLVYEYSIRYSAGSLHALGAAAYAIGKGIRRC